MPNLLQKLTNEIDRLLGGEIKELKFGCVVSYGSDFGQEPREVTIGNPYTVENGKVFNPYNRDDSDDLFEILGRPITLEDVIRAIKKIFGDFPTSVIIDAKEMTEMINMWQLGQPLSSQSTETIEKIAEILNVK